MLYALTALSILLAYILETGCVNHSISEGHEANRVVGSTGCTHLREGAYDRGFTYFSLSRCTALIKSQHLLGWYGWFF